MKLSIKMKWFREVHQLLMREANYSFAGFDSIFDMVEYIEETMFL